MTNAPLAQPASRPQRTPPRKGAGRIANLLAVASGKGGVGKTWLSVTLAHTLAHHGERVLLVDGDLGLANVDVQLGLTPRFDLAAVMAGTVSAREALHPIEGGAQPGTRGFDVLAGRSGSGALSAMRPDELSLFLRQIEALASGYDRVILDLGAGIDAPVRIMCAAANHILAVLTDEPTSLTDAYALIKVLKMRDPEAPLSVVVNLADSASQGRRTYQALAHACRSFLGQEPELSAIVRRDKLVKEAIRQQMSLLARYPQSSAAHDIEALATALKRQKTAEKSAP